MKAYLWFISTVLLLAPQVGAQIQEAISSEPVVVERGPDHRVWERVTTQVLPNGESILRRSSYEEIATGMHYLKDGQWVESKEIIELFQGGAVARQSGVQVLFSPNANSPVAIDLLTPDGQRLTSHVLGLNFYDSATGKSVLLAETKDCVGELHPPNVIVYQDAFRGISANLLYTYRRSGFEQDVILHENPPLPAGFNPATTRLEVWTEFTDFVAPDKIIGVRDGMTDEILRFGAMSIGPGSAFGVDNADGSGISAPVSKRWLQIDGRTFLVEAVRWTSIKPELDRLPAPKQAALKPTRTEVQMAQNGQRRALFSPRRKPAKAVGKIQTASIATRSPGLVLDYTLVMSTNALTLMADRTYYVSGPVIVTNLTIEGGTVVKYTNGASIEVYYGTASCRTETYHPSIFTARDDQTVGEKVGTNVVSGYYAGTALILHDSVYSFTNLRFSYATKCISLDDGGITLRHSQFINCGKALDLPLNGVSVFLENILMSSVTNAVSSIHLASVSGAHLTVDQCTKFFTDPTETGTLTLTNTLFVNVTNVGDVYLPSGTNGFITTTNSGIFQTVGSGSYYLATNSQYRNVGVSNLSASLLADLKQRTTYPPVVLATNISANTNLTPQVQRDTDIPDIGYHYVPLDYLVSGVIVASNVTVTATNGVAIGIDYSKSSWGFILDSARFVSEGNPLALNQITRAHAVQERSAGNPLSRAMFYDNSFAYANQPPRLCEARFRFSDCSQLAEDGYFVFIGLGFSNLEWNHSRIYNPSLVVDTSGTGTLICGLTNTLWERGGVEFGFGTSGAGIAAHLRNNLFRYVSLHFLAGSTNWTVRDNLFDTLAALTDHGSAVQNSYNAIYQTTNGLSGGTSNLTLTNLAYQVGALGNYYQPTNSALTNAGSRLASAAGLYQFTIATNQVKETNSQVDIGPHYVALGTNGSPFDTDGDGLADYFEDRNGNGTPDAGETSWQDPSPTVSLTIPTNGAVFYVTLNGSTNITLTATAADNISVTNVAFYSGANFLGQKTNSPYSIVWTNVTWGTYTLTAKATDNLGASTVSSQVSITVDILPTVSLTSPVGGAYFSISPTNVTVTATASDSDGTITNVGFYYSSTNFIAQVTNSPYTFAWSNVNGGNYALTARATDNRGGATTSAVVNITVNGGLDFGTNRAYVTFGNNTNLGLKNFTLECWFKRTATGIGADTGVSGLTNAIPLITKGRGETGSEGTSTDMNYFMGIASNNVLVADFEEGATGSSPGLNHPVAGVTAISTGLWYHAAATYDGTAWRLYLNGSLEAEKVISQPVRDDSIQHSALATAMDSTGTPAGYFYGVMDDVRIWGYARTGKQIRDNMDREISLDCDGLVAEWTLNEGIGTTIYNSIGTTITGTLKTNGWSWAGSATYQNGNALFVANSTNLSSAESNIVSRLQTLGYFVVTKAATSVASTNGSDKSLVVISSTVTSTDVNTKFTTNAVPVMTWKQDLYDDLGMVTSNTTYYGTTSGQTHVTITNPIHPLAGGLPAGAVTVVSNAATFAWGQPNSNAAQIATIVGSSTNYAVFGYEKGAAMPGLVAPARRVGLFMSDSNSVTGLNSNGWALFDAGFSWATTAPCPSVVDVMLVFDDSASMPTNTPPGGSNAFATAKADAKYIVTNMNLTLDRIGLVSFNSNSYLKAILTQNANTVLTNIDNLTGTASKSYIDKGITNAQGELTGTNHVVGAGTVIILLTDGLATDTSAAITAANQAKAAGTRVITIGLGGAIGTNTLHPSASCGDEYYLPGTNQLSSILSSITNSLCRQAIGQPSVSITSPTNSATLVGPLDIAINATASDTGASVTRVEFFNGSTSLGVDTTVPYSIIWSNVPSGIYTLKAVVTDSASLTATSALVTITVDQPPSVYAGPDQLITLPVNTAILSGTANDDGLPGGSVLSVTWTKVSGPGSVSFGNPYTTNTTATFGAGGVYTLRLTAHDTLATNSDDVVITVNPPPAVSITQPTNQMGVIGPTNISITATASDDGSVSKVEFFQGASKLGEDLASPYAFTWTNVAVGTYQLTARATDNLGATATSSVVNLTVSAPPTITITSPTNGVSFTTPANISIHTSLSNGVGTVTNVEFYQGTTKLGQDTSVPYTFLWSNVTNGAYNLTARLINTAGGTSTSSVVTVTVGDPRSRTFTRNVDFESGAMLNVNHDAVPHQLQLNQKTTPFPFVYIACSGRGTVVRIDANSGQILGEYSTAPNRSNYPGIFPRWPSRTAVDWSGNLWVANALCCSFSGGCPEDDPRASITKLGLVIGGTRGNKVVVNGTNSFVPDPKGEYLAPPFRYNTCIDRDGDGLIRTSRGLGQILSWTNTTGIDSAGSRYLTNGTNVILLRGVSTADDECLLNYTKVVPLPPPDHFIVGGWLGIAVDKNNDVWVSSSGDNQYQKVCGSNGVPITETVFQITGILSSGLLVDPNGILWTAGGDSNIWFNPSLRFDFATNPPIVTDSNYTGIAIGDFGDSIGMDPNTHEAWFCYESGFSDVPAKKVGTNGTLISSYSYAPSVLYADIGLAVDFVGNVWFANTERFITTHIRTNGTLVGNLEVRCGVPSAQKLGLRGIAVDANGKLWTPDCTSNNVFRIDPNGGPILLNGQLSTPEAGGFPLGAIDLVLDLNLTNLANASPDNYADMGGLVTLASGPPTGMWDVVHDSGTNGTVWGNVAWTFTNQPNTSLKVEVRACNTNAALADCQFLTVVNSNSLVGSNIVGRFIEVRVTFSGVSGTTNTPILYDLTVTADSPTPFITTNAPFIANDDYLFLFKGSVSNLLAVLTNDLDPDGLALTITNFTSPSWCSLCLVSNMFCYTPNSNFIGTDRFTYSVTNGQGGVGHGLVTLQVVDIKTNLTPPVATDDYVTVHGNSFSNEVFVLSNDANYDNVARGIMYASPPRHGSAQRSGCSIDPTTYPLYSGEILYAPARYFAGNDSFTYSILGTGGVVRSASVFVTVTGDPVKDIGCGQLLSGNLSTNDMLSLFKANSYADTYHFAGTNGTAVTIAASAAFGTTITVLTPLGSTNATGPSPLVCTLTNDGTYTVEVTSTAAGQTGPYSLSLQCSSAGGPEIAVFVSGTNVTNNAAVDFGSVAVNGSANKTVLITNQGNATLAGNIQPVSPPYTLSPTGAFSILTSSSLSLTLTFQPAAAGGFSQVVTITNTDVNLVDGPENPFKLNASGWGNALGSVPTVNITQPTNNAVFTAPASIAVAANASPSSGSITQVVFYANSSAGKIQIGSDTNAPYAINFTGAAPNNYTLTARAFDSSGRVADSSSVAISVLQKTANHPPVALDDFITVAVNSSLNVIRVLNNDRDSDGDSLSIASFTHPSGTVTSASGTFLYTPPANTIGEDGFTYTITDGNGATARAQVIISIAAGTFPTISITSPANDASINLPSSLTTTVSASGAIRTVQYFAGTEKIGETTNAPYTFIWTNTFAGDFLLTAVAIGTNGLTAKSDPVLVHLHGKAGNQIPIAYISNFTSTATVITGGLWVTNYPTIRDGLTNVIGAADDPDPGTTVTYELRVKTTDGSIVSSMIKSGAVASGTLGTLDLSMLRNGVYDLELRVFDKSDIAVDTRRFVLESQLKVGQFSFSQQDMVIPVNGIPLTVIRTYNSLNPNTGDFGYSWTYSINDMEMEIDEQRVLTKAVDNLDENEENDYFSMRVGGGRDVTLTMPDGRRATFYFTLVSGGCASCYTAQWIAPAGVYASLGATNAGDNTLQTVYGYPFWNDGGEYSTMDNYDFPSFVLTTQDGTKYFIDREDQGQFFVQDDDGNKFAVHAYGKGSLKRIVQRSGDRIEIDPGKIQHFNATNQPTRTVSFHRDSLNRIDAIYDPIGGANGLPVLTYAYDANGNLFAVSRLTDRVNGTYLTTTFEYSHPVFPHYITAIHDPLNTPIVRNDYDDSGRLLRHTDADGRTITYIHSVSNRLEIVTDRLNNSTTNAYDKRGNITAITNALAQVSLFAYDDTDHKTNENIGLLQTNSYSFDTSGFLTNSIVGGLQTNRFQYNSYGQLTNSIDGLGRGTTNFFDGNGFLLAVTNALSIGTTFTYDANGNQTSQKDTLGTITTNRYDSLGNLTNAATLILSNSQLVTLTSVSYTYDANGNRTNQTTTRTQPGGTQTLTNAYIYDAQNRAVQTIDPMGNTNSVVFNEIGKRSVTIDKLGRQTKYFYDAKGNLTNTALPDLTFEQSLYDAEGRRTNSVDRAGRPTTYVYDELGRLKTTIYPDNTTNATFYDAAGRVSQFVDARGTITGFRYDAAGRRTGVTNAFGISGLTTTTTYGYDGSGNQTNMVDGMNRSTDFQYDALNRRAAVLFPATVSGGLRATNLTGYDALGRRVAETNEAGIVARFGYDGLGRLIGVTNAAGAADATWVTYGYDEQGNMLTQTDALGRVTTFEYDALGRRTKRKLPGLQQETLGYDAPGNLLAHTNFNSMVITNEYDTLGRLLRRWASGTVLERYGYSPTGQGTSRTDASGNYSWIYDARDRVRTNNTPVGTLYHDYDVNGNLTNLYSSTVGGASIGYSYDVLNRMINVVDNRLTGTKNTSYGYDGVGNLTVLQYPNGVTNQWQYDTRNRLTNEVWKLGSGTLASFFYQLAVAGNRTNLTENLNIANRANAWAYDNLYRLTSETISGAAPTGAISYNLDKVGNRTSRTSGVAGVGTTNNFFDVNDWLDIDNVTNNGSAWFDANGNTRTNGPTSYMYDWADRLTNVNGGALVNFVYDGDGNRVVKTANGVITLYLVDARNPSGYAQVVEEFNVSGGLTNLSRAYTYGLDLISQRQVSPALTTFYGYDGLGSTRFLMGTNGLVTDTTVYDAYGTVITNTGSAVNYYLYAGEQWDSDLGLYYLRARYYSANVGRFWTMDSFDGNQSDPLALHKYLYAQGNPVNNTDQSGHETLTSVMASVEIRLLVAVAAVSVTAVNYEKYVRRNGGNSDQPQLPDLNSPYLKANHHSIRIRNAKKNLDEMFERLRYLNVPEGVASRSGTLPVSGVGQRIGWDLPFMEEAGQADFFVDSVKFSNSASGSGPGDHFFAVVTLGGHPLRGWRFWRAHRVSGDIVIETGAVDEPNGLLGRIKSWAGGDSAIMQLWQGLLDDALIYSGGQRVTPDSDYDFPQGHWVPGRKQEFLGLVR